ncbi:MAG: hypothetical protein QM808_09950 [Steroidobacteraceae bacterium]
MKGFFERLRISKLVKAGSYSHVPLDLSGRRDNETFGLLDPPQIPARKGMLFSRKLQEEEQLMYWRLHASSFAPAYRICDAGYETVDGSVVSRMSQTIYTVP